ncbi:hypothetical protein Sant_1921 [Sodalis praecaptivus]|uniref:YdgH/BhsA/McbA-like domain-containing protein n=1 Tax=Sodalis praecaptivus TaxID=1239307 RepID=W0HXV8_9GAMM|nr:DUF1471 family protein YdgH [Sodalis praecaptivus]AHF76973.1 hypothetical protein Sant_1921 [Sodalis praecaptivus]
MKLKKTLLTSALMTLLTFTAQAAQELSPEKAASLQPFERINITGRFNAINDAAAAVSRRADQVGAAAFYVVNINDANNSGNWRVTADLYRQDAPAASTETQYRVFNGVKELPRTEANLLEPYDTVSVNGFYRNQPEINDAISKAAKAKGADSYYIVRQINANQGGNQFATAFIYRADAPKRVVQSPDKIPANSEAGKAALAAGGAAAANVEIPGVASSESPSSKVGRFFETQSTRGTRYTVTLPDGTKIQEVNNITAAQMVPFDSISFTGHFNSSTDISTETARRAAKKGAKFYHITRQWQQNQSGSNLTISADLFK